MRGTAGADSGVGSAGFFVVLAVAMPVVSPTASFTPNEEVSVLRDGLSAPTTADTTVATAELGLGLMALPAPPGAGAVGLGGAAFAKNLEIESCFMPAMLST